MVRFPKLSQWKQIFKVLEKNEKIALLVFFILGISSLSFLTIDFYIQNTVAVPAFGGIYTEGVVGQPRFINPIYGETNDIDRTLIDLVYSGLETYDKNGNIVNDLADHYTISDDGKTYTFTLKNNVFWQDGKPLTADDVLFTIKTIQNSDYKSPLRANWIDVDTQKLSDKSIKFVLKQPYNSFLENCTLKIIPKHIWENISPENFTLSVYNLQPIGAGPFAFTGLTQTKTGFIQSLQLQSNRNYYGEVSYIAGISFKFYQNADDLAKGANAGEINGFAAGNLDKNSDIQNQIKKGWPGNQVFNRYDFSLPRYFAVFFNNQKTSIFADKNIRQALSHSVNKTELAQKIAGQTQTNIDIIDSPILPGFYGYQASASALAFDTETAKTLLDKSGFKDNGQGGRVKTTTKKAAFQFKSYLKLGSKGAEVTQLQACLIKLPNKNDTAQSDSFANILKGETNGTYGKPTEEALTQFQKEYLPAVTPTGEVGAASRQLLNTLCSGPATNSQTLAFTLVTINQPQLMEAANLLKNYWQAAGVAVTVNAVSITDLKPIIKNRAYDALLYGQALGMEPDLYPFWYSAQKLDPGLNLSSYENKDVDKLLKEARQTLDPDLKKQDLEKIQNLIAADAPALFLYNPDFTYWVSQKVSGVDTTKIADPAKRFVNINSWYLQTKRVWK